MNYYEVGLKKGLGKPKFVYAENEVEAKKMGLAEFMRTDGHSETVDKYSTVENTIDYVKIVD